MKKLLAPLISSAAFVTAGTVAAPPPPPDNLACAKTYQKIFSQPVVNVGVAIGYFDYTVTESKAGKVIRKYRQAQGKTQQDAFWRQLVRPCTGPKDRACGFTPKGNLPFILTKPILGPEGKGHTLRIEINYAALTGDDEANRANPAQAENSKRVEEAFLRSVRDNPITFYSGHSRDGGGPDFDPAVLNSAGETDYDYYHHHPKDRDAMMAALRETTTPARILGFLSCNSIRWFDKRAAAAAPKTGVIGSTGDLVGAGAEEFAIYLNKILNFECLDEVKLQDKGPEDVWVQMARPWEKVEAGPRNYSAYYASIVDEELDLLEGPDPALARIAYEDLRTVPIYRLDREQYARYMRGMMNFTVPRIFRLPNPRR